MSKMSSRDPNQIVQYTHDEQLNANRVVLVGSDMTELTDSIKESIASGLKDLKIELNQAPQYLPEVIMAPEPKIVYVDKPVIQKEVEYREIEKQIIVKEIEQRVFEVQTPVIVTEYKIFEVEKPVIVKEMIKEPVSSLIKNVLIGQSVIIGILLLVILLK